MNQGPCSKGDDELYDVIDQAADDNQFGIEFYVSSPA